MKFDVQSLPFLWNQFVKLNMILGREHTSFDISYRLFSFNCLSLYVLNVASNDRTEQFWSRLGLNIYIIGKFSFLLFYEITFKMCILLENDLILKRQNVQQGWCPIKFCQWCCHSNFVEKISSLEKCNLSCDIHLRCIFFYLFLVRLYTLKFFLVISNHLKNIWTPCNWICWLRFRQN